MSRKIGTICMLLGTVLILAALSLFLFNRKEDTQAEQAVEQVLPLLIERLEAPEETGGEEVPTYPDPYDPAMTEVEIGGYAYIGYLSIPSLELELPIMSQWDYERLKIAPCRYTGSTKTGNLVLAAHNYTKHFGLLQKLSAGDAVIFTDMDGITSCYEVALVEVLAPTDVEEMTAGEYDLTLFTCTYGGQSRVTVRCERANTR